jgi:acyl carrier protein
MNEEKLKKAFAAGLGISVDSVSDTLAYQSIKQWDSIAHMALVAALETDFNVMLDTDQILDLSSVAKAREILALHGVVFP